jgi:hypothetical protein
MAGIFRDAQKAAESRVADFSYAPNDTLAQLIVDCWVDKNFRDILLNGAIGDRKKAAKALFGAQGFFWNGTSRTPLVITEAEFDQGWVLSEPGELCFVLPDHDGTCPPGQNLLETARLLMAATPNGI